MSDFDLADNGNFYLKHGDWFSIYRNRGNPNYDPVGPKHPLHINICKELRIQLKTLWSRIISVKRGQIYPSIIFTTTGFPNYVKTNLCEIILEKLATYQVEINAVFHWSNDKKNEILSLIQSKNPFERLCDNLSTTLMHNSLSHVSEKDAKTIKKDKDETIRLSYEEMKKAGMNLSEIDSEWEIAAITKCSDFINVVLVSSEKSCALKSNKTIGTWAAIDSSCQIQQLDTAFSC